MVQSSHGLSLVSWPNAKETDRHNPIGVDHRNVQCLFDLCSTLISYFLLCGCNHLGGAYFECIVLASQAQGPSPPRQLHFAPARQAKFVICDYTIEELFRTLKKQGLNVESSQLESGKGLRKLLLMSLHAALIIMQLVGDRDGEAGESAGLVFNEEETECLKEVGKNYEGKTEKQKNPFEEGSLAWAAWIIGRLGGWKGYRKAGPAGPITMKRGLERFSILFKGWLLREAVEIA
jgi:hypothetical protein